MVDPKLAEDLERLHASTFGWALACCRRDRSEAEDVLQQAYWKVLSGRARFDGHAPFRTWLFGVVRLTAMEHRRWRFSRSREVSTAEPPDAPASDPQVDGETARALASAVAGLPVRQREVVHLVFYEGLTIAEAAEVLAVSLGTARTHYERGKASLVRLLREKGIGMP